MSGKRNTSDLMSANRLRKDGKCGWQIQQGLESGNTSDGADLPCSATIAQRMQGWPEIGNSGSRDRHRPIRQQTSQANIGKGGNIPQDRHAICHHKPRACRNEGAVIVRSALIIGVPQFHGKVPLFFPSQRESALTNWMNGRGSALKFQASAGFGAEVLSAICLPRLFLRRMTRIFEPSRPTTKIGRIGTFNAYAINHPAPFGMDE